MSDSVPLLEVYIGWLPEKLQMLQNQSNLEEIVVFDVHKEVKS